MVRYTSKSSGRRLFKSSIDNANTAQKSENKKLKRSMVLRSAAHTPSVQTPESPLATSTEALSTFYHSSSSSTAGPIQDFSFIKHIKDGHILKLFGLRHSSQLNGLGIFINKFNSAQETENSRSLRATKIDAIHTDTDNQEIFKTCCEELTDCIPNSIQGFEIFSYGLEWDEELTKSFYAFCLHHWSGLISIHLRCRIAPVILKAILQVIPPYVIELDLSYTVINSDVSLIEPVTKLIRRNGITILRMVECGKQSYEFRWKFFRALEDLGTDLRLDILEGIQLYDIKDIPSSIAGAMLSSSNSGAAATKVLEYMKNKRFSTLLRGSRIRVWWPPTTNEQKTDFSGRFWSGILVAANPLTLVATVKYDNGDVENVEFENIQPLSPYTFGGGLSRFAVNHINQYQQIVESSKFDQHILHNEESASKSKPKTKRVRAAIGGVSEINGLMSADHSATPGSTQDILDDIWPSFPNWVDVSSPSRRQDSDLRYGSDLDVLSTDVFESSDDLLRLSDPIIRTVLRRMDDGPDTETEISQQLISELFNHIGSVLTVGEICEFCDVDEDDSNYDPSDFLGVVVGLEEDEPIYRIRYIYHDDDDDILVSSRHCRRAVIVNWQDWRDWKLEKNFNLQSPYLWGTSKRALTNRDNYSNLKSFHHRRSSKSASECCCEVGIGGDGRRRIPCPSTCTKCVSWIHPIEYFYPPFLPLCPWIEDNKNLLRLKSEITLSNLKVKHRIQHPPSPMQMRKLPVDRFSEWFLLSLCEKICSTSATSDLTLTALKLHPLINGIEKVNRLSSATKNELLGEIRSLMRTNSDLRHQISKKGFLLKDLQQHRDMLHESRSKIMELESELNCILCLERKRNCILMPCKHWCFCAKCTTKLIICPLCRAHITSRSELQSDRVVPVSTKRSAR